MNTITVPERRAMIDGYNRLIAEARQQGAETLARRWASERDRVLCNAELDAATDRSIRRINCSLDDAGDMLEAAERAPKYDTY